MRIRIGPFLIEVTGDAPTLESLRPPFEHYFAEEPTADPSLHFDIRCGAPSELEDTRGSLYFGEAAFAISYRQGQARAIYREREPDDIEVPLNVAFMHALALHAIDQGALLTHASSVLEEGKAWVFVGRSGAGKSTLASWFAPEQVLNDDFVLLHRTVDGAAQIASQPFFGKSMATRVGRRLGGPPNALFTLRHTESVRIVSCTSTNALQTLMASIAVPSVARSHQARALELTEGWLNERWRTLQFNLDREATLRALRASTLNRTD